jgi:predicted RND superfamily exporter protein
MAKLLTFFGFLYIAVDIAMVMGFKLSMGLLYQPLIALFIIPPLIGIMLKAEGERG